MKIKYNKPTLAKLEKLFKDLGYTIRYEKGQFKSGYCLIYQKKIVVINKFLDTKGRIESFLDILNEISFGAEALPEPLVAMIREWNPDFQQGELSFNAVA